MNEPIMASRALSRLSRLSRSVAAAVRRRHSFVTEIRLLTSAATFFESGLRWARVGRRGRRPYHPIQAFRVVCPLRDEWQTVKLEAMNLLAGKRWFTWPRLACLAVT